MFLIVLAGCSSRCACAVAPRDLAMFLLFVDAISPALVEQRIKTARVASLPTLVVGFQRRGCCAYPVGTLPCFFHIFDTYSRNLHP